MEDIHRICSQFQKDPTAPWCNHSDALSLSFSEFLQLTHQALNHPSYSADIPFAPQDLSQTILTIGGATVDLITRLHEPIVVGETEPASFLKVLGGVARNIADNFARLGIKNEFVGPLGQDENGELVLQALSELSIEARFVLMTKKRMTAAYMAVMNHDGSLHLFAVYAELLWQWFEEQLLVNLDALALFWQHYRMWLCDLHFNADVTRRLIDKAQEYNKDFYIVAVSERNMNNLPEDLTGLKGLILNVIELAALVERDLVTREEIEQAALEIQKKGVENLFVTCGADGVLSLDAEQCFAWYEATKNINSVDFTGAGDALTAGLLAAELHGAPLPVAVRAGMLTAERVIQHLGAICTDLTPELLADFMRT